MPSKAMNCMGCFTCDVKCDRNYRKSVEQNCSYSDYFNAISGFTSNSRAPGGPVTFIPITKNLIVTLNAETFQQQLCTKYNVQRAEFRSAIQHAGFR